MVSCKAKPIPIEKPPVAVAKTNKSTPHQASTPRMVATKIPLGKNCFADFGTPSFFLLAYPGGLELGIIGSKPWILFSSLQISIGNISSGLAPGFSFRPDWLFPVIQLLKYF